MLAALHTHRISPQHRASPPVGADGDMGLVKLGNKQAFSRVVQAHQKAIFAYCLRFVRDPELAKDMVQDVFLTLWQQRESYDERGRFRFYLLKIARLRCLAAVKKRRSRDTLGKVFQHESLKLTHVKDPREKIADADAFHKALNRLKAEQVDVLVLRHLEGLNLREMTEVTGLREGTIKSRLNRALKALHKELDHASV